MVEWTWDSSQTIRLFQTTTICDIKWLETPGSVKTWFFFSFVMILTGMCIRANILCNLSGLAYFAKEKT